MGVQGKSKDAEEENQKPLIEEAQATHWPKGKGRKGK